MKIVRWICSVICFVISYNHLSCFCNGLDDDTLRAGQSLKNNETLTSAGGIFELGFFSIDGPSSNHYLGIWFKNDKQKKPIWVANRENPVLDDSGVLTIRYDGNLVITDIRTIPIIVNYGMVATSGSTSAKIFDSGNLVLTVGEKVVWQSFNYPSDTFLPGMKLGLFDLDTDHIRKQFLVSWLSPVVPTTGTFALGLDWNNRSVFNVWRRDGVFRQIGYFDGHKFRFFFRSTSNNYNFTFVSSSKEIYLTFNATGSDMSWFVLTSSGEINEFTTLDHGIAIVNHTLCEGKNTVGSGACLIPLPSMCGNNDEFSEIRGSLPNSMIVSSSSRMGPSDCEIMCRSNCSCLAYASFRQDGTGCELYFGNRKDLLHNVGRGNSIIYVRRIAPKHSELEKKRKLLLTAVLPVVSLMIASVISVCLYIKWRRYKQKGDQGREVGIRETVSLLLYQFGNHVGTPNNVPDSNVLELGERKDPELPHLSFSSIETSTGNFSPGNKIGEGGFGPVYKGRLLEHEFAVKRLSRMSGQGLEEFKSELLLISKLQHSNLVRLLGYCIHQDEKILIYEYMPNKSLDTFLFEANKRSILDWRRRMHIIEGIAQGLLYLHKYSRLRIIHRDLKTSNILLDGYFNPKISDFGMARIFEEKSQAKTKRVVGTYGYMSPEYAVHGLYSTKSDVFSFGVIMLEIITGKKNTSFYQSDRSLNLLGYVWETWNEGCCADLVDQTLVDSLSMEELMLRIQVALLCIQEIPKNRPTMSDVVSMLSNERTNLPVPKRPAFSTVDSLGVNSPEMCQCYSNDVTLSEIEARSLPSLTATTTPPLTSCLAYASFRQDGTGCELYFGNGRDLLHNVGRGNSTIYVRGIFPKHSELEKRRKLLLGAVLPVVSVMIAIVISVCLYIKWRRCEQKGDQGREVSIRETVSLLLYQFGSHVGTTNNVPDSNVLELGERKDHELVHLSFSSIETATGNFSLANKIGEGGFGPVYKGKLLEQEFAIKRLSRMSGQGLEEFKSELQLISKLQHRNLVRLLGYCIHQDEKILIYEYMPNRSLDTFLFEANERSLLDWRRRMHIIEGIAQGLLYLHKYSRFRIIHRDLKTSNILLDSYFNPKISDFGMARIFEEKSQAKTKRVVGTYGYMSPEYAVHGLYSTKSDVFSFGVIMLEIITGKKNTSFYQSDRSLNLLGYVWETWNKGCCGDLVDQTLVDSLLMEELMLRIQVALLCIQEIPRDRPTMSDVVSMLNNERTNLPVPKRPAFSTLDVLGVDSPELHQCYSNDVTLSEIDAR